MSPTRGPQFSPALGSVCLLGAVLWALGCSHPSKAPESVAAGTAPPAPAGAPAPAATQAVPPPTVTLVRAADLSWQAGPVLEGAVASRLERGELGRTQWRRIAGPEPVWLALDQHAPRSLGSVPLRLTQLFNEDEELAPGRHRLVALKRRADGFVVQTAQFWVETQEETSAPAGCVLLAPAGTLNGAQAADTSQLLLVPLDAASSQVQVSLGGSQLSLELPAQHVLAVQLSPLPSGDLAISVSCAQGAAGHDQVTRTITVNRELGPAQP